MSGVGGRIGVGVNNGGTHTSTSVSSSGRPNRAPPSPSIMALPSSPTVSITWGGLSL